MNSAVQERSVSDWSAVKPYLQTVRRARAAKRHLVGHGWRGGRPKNPLYRLLGLTPGHVAANVGLQPSETPFPIIIRSARPAENVVRFGAY